MVSAEHHAHVSGVVAFAHFCCQPGGFGGGWITQFVREGLHGVVVLFTFFANIAIRTNGKAVQRDCAFLCPFGERLRQQVEAGDQK